MANRTKITLLSFPVIALTACVQQINPIWQTYFSTSDNNNNIEWLNDLTLDNSNDLLLTGSNITAGANRNEDALLAKYNQQGSQVWSTKYDLPPTTADTTSSDEKLIETAIDLDGSIYSVGQRIEKMNGTSEQSSFVMKVDQDGHFIWSTKISNSHDAFDLEITNNSIYVTGYATQKLSLEGKTEWKIKHDDRAWDVEVDALGNVYVASKQALEQYNAEGVLVWRVEHDSTGLSSRVNIELDESNDSLMLLQADENNRFQLHRYSTQGDLNWNHSINLTADENTTGMPLLLVENDAIWFAISNDSQMKVGQISRQGNAQWTFSEQQGPIRDLAKLANGNIAITGAGHSVLLDSRGKLLAMNDSERSASNISGSLVVDGNKMFVATSVSATTGGISIHLAMFEQ
jgi:hypothetical protein